MIGQMMNGFVTILIGSTLPDEIMANSKTSTKLKILHKPIKRKQTYEEYVRERLNIERLLK